MVIMASGFGRRFGGNKLMVSLQGKPLIQWALDATEGVFDRRIVVTRYEEVQSLCKARKQECILHDFPGQNDTIRLGLTQIKDEVDVCFFLPGDQPFLTRDTITRLVEYAKNNPNRIVRSCFKDIEGSPVGFPKQTFEELLKLPEEKGGSVVIRRHPELVEHVFANAEYELWDIDVREDMDRMEKIMNFAD